MLTLAITGCNKAKVVLFSRNDAVPQVNIALSLHSVQQEVRERLVPLAKQYPLDQLREALRQLSATPRAECDASKHGTGTVPANPTLAAGVPPARPTKKSPKHPLTNTYSHVH